MALKKEHTLNKKMREALALAMEEDAEQFEVQSESTLDAKLMSWSSAIKKGFVIDNIQGLEMCLDCADAGRGVVT